MKIVFFSDQREVRETLEKVINPTPYGVKEVKWELGGMTLTDEEYYVILEDDAVFENLTEEDFINQYKQQAKFDLAKILEDNRVNFMVEGILIEKEEEFELDKQKIDNLTSIEEIQIFLLEKNR